MCKSYWKDKVVIVTGGAGFLGTYVMAELLLRGLDKENVVIPRSTELDLTRADAVGQLFQKVSNIANGRKIIVIHLAAQVGGIGANRDNPGKFYYDNLMMGTHLIEFSRQVGVERFVCLGTVCAYPKYAKVPFNEDDLWNGYPEETNAPYGIAKKALLVQLQAYAQQYNFPGVYLLPVNLYGPGDNFDLNSSHVIPALIRKCVEAKAQNSKYIEVWGTGSASREFLYVLDCAKAIGLACEVPLEKFSAPAPQYVQPLNLGTSQEITIHDLVTMIAALTGFQGEIRWDKSKPDGQPRRCLDTTKALLRLNWKATTTLQSGLKETIQWYINSAPKL